MEENTKLPEIVIDAGIEVNIKDNFGKARGSIRFNPTDMLFAEKFYRFYRDVKEKGEEFDKQQAGIEPLTEENADSVAPRQIALAKERYTYLCSEFNKLFGDGTAERIVPDQNDVFQLFQVIDGVSKFFDKERIPKVEKYISPRHKHPRNTKN